MTDRVQTPATSTEGLFVRLAARPWRALALFILVQVSAWTVLPASVSTAPPLDVIEALVWGREWLIGTFKHPPLPAWLAEISLHATGSPIVGPLLAGQICVALTYLFVFLFGQRVTTERNALLGTVLLAGVYYFTWPTSELNHNLVQLPIWSGMFLLLAIARDHPRHWAPWIGLGVAAGIAIYAKYSVLVLYFVIGVWVLYEKPLRRAILTPWPWLGAVTALLVALPQILYAVSTDFSQLEFAKFRGGAGSAPVSLDWLATQALDHAPLPILLAIIGIGAIRRLPKPARRNANLGFVAYLVLAAPLSTAAIAAIGGFGLLDMWGMPMFSLSGLFAVLLVNRTWTDALAGRAMVSALGVVIVVAAAQAIAIGVSARTNGKMRMTWPMQDIAEAALSAWHEQTDAPLKIVSGEFWLAGMIANGGNERPSVIYDGQLSLSPWIDPASLERDGVLYVWSGQEPPAWMDLTRGEIVSGTLPVTGVAIPEDGIGYAIRKPGTR